MKKMLILCIVLVGVFAATISANQLGFGYNNGGPSVRFKWDDNIVSELSVMISYSNQKSGGGTDYVTAVNNMTFVISPINMTLFKGPLGEVNVGFKIKDILRFEEGVAGGEKYSRFTANDYGLDIMLPELEMSVPGVDGLKLIGSIGISSSWSYDGSGKLESFTTGIYGISLASVGIIYYFNLPAAPAPQPQATPVPEPAKTEDAGGNKAK